MKIFYFFNLSFYLFLLILIGCKEDDEAICDYPTIASANGRNQPPVNDDIKKGENNNTFEIKSFFIEENINIITGPVKQVNYAVLQVSDKTIKGFIGWASQGNADYYISGSLKNKSYSGNVYFIGCENNCKTPVGQFELTIKDSKLKLTGNTNVGHNEIPIYKGKHFFDIGNQSNLMSEANRKARILIKNFTNDHKKGVEILEIGKYEKINDEYNLWYKVKINNMIGWVFGGLCTVCID